MLKTIKMASSSLIISLLFVAGCGPGISDYSYKVSGGYSVWHNSAHVTEVIPDGGYTDKSQIIPPKVIKIAWNEQYIIAEQQGLKRKYPDNPLNSSEEPDDIFYYWILDTKIKKAYGPFDKETFELKKKEFQIPESIKLKDVRSYYKD